MNLFRCVAAAALLASGNIVAPAIAHDSPADVPQARVSYADLNLASDSGVAVLKRRVASAIDRICDSGSGTLREQMERHSCKTAAKRLADRDIDLAVNQARSDRALAQLDRSLTVSK